MPSKNKKFILLIHSYCLERSYINALDFYRVNVRVCVRACVRACMQVYQCVCVCVYTSVCMYVHA